MTATNEGGSNRKAGRGAADESDAEVTFEQALERLERIVGELEDGRLGLVDSLERYAEGVRRLKQCYRTLEQVERKIELLSGVDAQGLPVVEPMTDDSLTLEEKVEARSRRRSRAARPAEAERPASSEEPGGAGGPDEGGEGGGESVDRGRRLF